MRAGCTASLAAAEESPALSCSEWDGKTLAELGLCEMEHPLSDSNTCRSALASCE